MQLTTFGNIWIYSLHFT